jgi:hypothetical protein
LSPHFVRFEHFLGTDNVARLAQRYRDLRQLVAAEPWRSILLVDPHPLAVGFAARQRWLEGERPAARELYALGNLVEAWQRVVEACPIVKERDLPRRRLLQSDPLPVIQEVLLAAYFLRAGLPVDPICLHSSGNPDLVVTCDDSPVSIEIKNNRAEHRNEDSCSRIP